MSYREIKTFNVVCDFCKMEFQMKTVHGEINLLEYLRSLGWDILFALFDRKDKCPRCVNPPKTYTCDHCGGTELESGNPVGWSIRTRNTYCRWCVDLEDRGVKLKGGE